MKYNYLCASNVAKFTKLLFQFLLSEGIFQIFNVQIDTLVTRDALLSLFFLLARELALTLCFLLSSVTIDVPPVDYGIIHFADSLEKGGKVKRGRGREWYIPWRHLHDFQN